MKKYLFLLACFSFLMAQCQKESDTFPSFVTGKITSVYDNRPIPDAIAELVELTGSVGVSGSYKALDSVKVDNTGKFHFDFIAKKGVQYAVRGRHPRYRYLDYSVSYFNHGVGAQNNLPVSLSPYSYIKVRIKDTSRIERYTGVYFFALNKQDDITILKNPIDTTVITQDVYISTWFLTFR